MSRRRRCIVLALLLILAALASSTGCAGKAGALGVPDLPLLGPLPGPAGTFAPGRDYLIWSNDAGAYAELWMAEARGRSANAFGVFCHGGSRGGEWCAFPGNRDAPAPGQPTGPRNPRPPAPMLAVAWLLHDLMPDRDVYYFDCNADDYALPVPRAYHARHKVLNHPRPGLAGKPPPDCVVDISDFVCDWNYDGN